MGMLLVTAELKTTGQNYDKFYEAIKSNSTGWWHYLEHIWIVETYLSADAFAKALFPFMTKSDYLLVIRLQKEYQGWLPDEAWKWLAERNY